MTAPHPAYTGPAPGARVYVVNGFSVYPGTVERVQLTWCAHHGDEWGPFALLVNYCDDDGDKHSLWAAPALVFVEFADAFEQLRRHVVGGAS